MHQLYGAFKRPAKADCDHAIIIQMCTLRINYLYHIYHVPASYIMSWQRKRGKHFLRLCCHVSCVYVLRCKFLRASCKLLWTVSCGHANPSRPPPTPSLELFVLIFKKRQARRPSPCLAGSAVASSSTKEYSARKSAGGGFTSTACQHLINVWLIPPAITGSVPRGILGHYEDGQYSEKP